MDRLEVFEGVYAPSEDTFLLWEVLKDESGTFLEVGCGSGYISTSYALKNGQAECCDKEVLALKNACWNALLNNTYVKAFYSDVFSEVEKKYDVIAFNPPYLNRKVGDEATEDNGSMWRFISEVKEHLHPGGRAYILISTENERYGELRRLLEGEGWAKVAEEELFFERLEVWRVKKGV